jgi:hypothetical protein
MRVGHDPARVDHKRLAADEPFLHAARHRSLKQLAQKVALAEAGTICRSVTAFDDPRSSFAGTLTAADIAATNHWSWRIRWIETMSEPCPKPYWSNLD